MERIIFVRLYFLLIDGVTIGILLNGREMEKYKQSLLISTWN